MSDDTAKSTLPTELAEPDVEAMKAAAAEPSKVPENIWPQVAPRDGEIYGFLDPVWNAPMVAMNVATWQQFMQNAATMKLHSDALKAENARLKLEKPRIVMPGFGRA